MIRCLGPRFTAPHPGRTWRGFGTVFSEGPMSWCHCGLIHTLDGHLLLSRAHRPQPLYLPQPAECQVKGRLSSVKTDCSSPDCLLISMCLFIYLIIQTFSRNCEIDPVILCIKCEAVVENYSTTNKANLSYKATIASYWRNEAGFWRLWAWRFRLRC